ncbi:AsnC family transcriptional regulator [Candidatus Bathyarchaeota archaeon]|nr:AsnC family transcriptional regulator [Candidatus Bathyarchaeota archaeon]NIU80862.1 AsnC family transcriptional regulator [Candidatus Bathyarchaeota archaeon]NIV67503.1 AsnC family transcriptional regulator [Candidatus Bathyarchaeota archaeon]NIW34108.1 AsnC family transcriptional regulator [Candidatus Bathyarchaeota archaeon]
MSDNLDFSNLRILDGLAEYGPRNVTEVARRLDMHPETLRKRLKSLQSKIFLRLHVSIYHTNLGLKKALIIADAVPGYEDLLFRCLKANGFWIFVGRCYGMMEGCVAIYTIPKDHCGQFEEFLKELRRVGVARSLRVYWSTCFQGVQAQCKWFDPEKETWNFQWERWLKEIPREGTELPYTLVEPEYWPVKADKLDVLILKELEKDATISFVELARKLEVSPQLLGYHYRNHLEEKGLIEGFEVTVFHFGRENSDFIIFIFNFHNYENLAKFASSLLDKPFVKALGKILGRNTLYGYIYLPKTEFRNFIDCLSRLIRDGLLRSYQYVFQDLKKSSRQTISYEYFRDGEWIYNHEEHLHNLHQLIEEERPRHW